VQTPLRWLTGRRLSDDAPCAVPAFAVYLPYQPEPGEPLVAPGISTGLSCAASLEAAVLGGMCEVIERDALALCWLAGLALPRIPQPSILEEAADLLPPSDETVAYDLTSSVGVPVVLIVCRGEGPRGPLLSVGSACHLDARRAVRKAALEASQDRVFVRELVELDPDWQPREDFSNLTDFSLHARLYSVRPDLADEALSFLNGNSEPAELPALVACADSDATQERGEIARRLVAAGHDGAWVDLTPEPAANLGLHVVKVVVPSLLPLHGHHLLAYLGHARLADRRAAMPRSSVLHEHATWPYPHPFP
jgi:ribosomal protein S12 methylthiotransferase accessory factor